MSAASIGAGGGTGGMGGKLGVGGFGNKKLMRVPQMDCTGYLQIFAVAFYHLSFQ